ncbi:hypothetical protein [Bradyrhizobium mercantei]|uniref:hypothetical protein n=1 Tax=Bradyrhizobium mercantei TaxID=1904807 RepID=UPI0011776B4E|nr:hypothetical protein [Bradyrhizobium mercantei]
MQPNDAQRGVAWRNHGQVNHGQVIFPVRHHYSIKETIMPISFMESVSGPARRHFSFLLLRFRRIVNRSVAGMLAHRERQAISLLPREPGGRQSKAAGIRWSRPIIRTAVLGLMIAGLSSPVFTRAEEPVVREHRAALTQHAAAPQRSSHGCRHRSDWSIVTAAHIPVLLDRRT